MARQEHRCPRCGQLNARYTGLVGALYNPRFASECGACHADLKTGRRDPLTAIFGWLTLDALYLVHAMVGAGLVMVVAFFVPELWMHRGALGALFGVGAIGG